MQIQPGVHCNYIVVCFAYLQHSFWPTDYNSHKDFVAVYNNSNVVMCFEFAEAVLDDNFA